MGFNAKPWQTVYVERDFHFYKEVIREEGSEQGCSHAMEGHAQSRITYWSHGRFGPDQYLVGVFYLPRNH